MQGVVDRDAQPLNTDADDLRHNALGELGSQSTNNALSRQSAFFQRPIVGRWTSGQ